ncbi:hypothetical protein OS31_13540 [Dickeya oryzae]
MTTKITVLGTRGIPNVLGGVETHCQNLYPTIKQQFDVDICVLARSPYVNYKQSHYRGIKTRALLAPKKTRTGSHYSLGTGGIYHLF